MKACMPILLKLSKIKSKRQRNRLLKLAKKNVYYSICDVAYNVLKGNIPLAEKNKIKLRPYSATLREISRKSGISLKKRKKLINNQVGGFLPALLIPALSIIGQIIADRVSK